MHLAQFSDCERSIIIQYKQKAIEKEYELACRRREKVEQLRTLVQQKIANAEVANGSVEVLVYFPI